MQHSVRHKRKAQRDRLGLILLLSAILVGSALFAISKYVQGNRPVLDSATMCPVGGPTGLIVLLVDTTDPLTLTRQADLKNHLERIKQTLPKHSAIDVYTVSDVKNGLLKPLGARVCNPGDGRDANAFTSNPRMIKEKWDKRFSEPLDNLFGEMLASPPADQSPIFESIQSVAVTAFGGLTETTTNRRLVIISDMLQNMPEYSQYHQIGSFDEFRRTPYYLRISADLRGVEVELYYVRRDNAMQGTKHVEFWQQYFKTSGATLVHVVALQG
jgi:hypothetical protein